MERNGEFRPLVAVCVLGIALGSVADAQYAGGSGTADDPYLIATPQQMNAIGADPNDWDKHFKLIADIDLAQYTGHEFNLIGGADGVRDRPFTGVFDGNDHVIDNFMYSSSNEESVGLFRFVSGDGEIRNVGLTTPSISVTGGTDSRGRMLYGDVGALVGRLDYATITGCHVQGGSVSGESCTGGLVGVLDGSVARYPNEETCGRVEGCYSTCRVDGGEYVGGLVGQSTGLVANCCADGIVTGSKYVGGLVGDASTIRNCYAQGFVLGEDYVGGLAGSAGYITYCYATAAVLAEWHGGGLVADAGQTGMSHQTADTIVASFWDIQTSRQPTSAGGVGKTTAQMQTLLTFRTWGEGDNAETWTLDEGHDYPRLAWEQRPGIVIEALEFVDLLRGAGTRDDPYLICTVDELKLITEDPNEWDEHFKLMADIDLSGHPGVAFNAGWSDTSDNSYPFTGVFDGNGHVISNFTYFPRAGVFPGFFGWVEPVSCSRRDLGDCDPNVAPGIIRNLGLLDPIVGPFGGGALVEFLSGGTVANCYIKGGLVMNSAGNVGGLIACSYDGTVTQCYTVGMTVIGGSTAGGLVGYNEGDIANCYSKNDVLGTEEAGDWWFPSEGVGGLVGSNRGSVANCYSASAVSGKAAMGGLVGYDSGEVVASFWNVETSGQAESDGGTGLTMAEMMTAAPFLEAGWDFVGEAENGTDEIWWIEEGADYPRLWWEATGIDD